MKIAISSKGKDLSSEVDPRFGRAAYLIIVDTDTMAFEVVDNAANVNSFKGAGIQAATMVYDKGAEVLMTGYCGPKAFQTLQAAGVKVVSDISGTVAEAVEMLKSGKIEYTDAANADAHW
jgi:predicted Fe-Mo cluster-binding NifX family protein